MLRWVSISSARRVIDFHSVTFFSGVCDFHTGGGRGYYFPSGFALCCRPLYRHAHTYVYSTSLQWLKGCNLRNPFRPHQLLLIALLLTPSAGGTGSKMDTQVITKTLLQQLQLKSYIRTNCVLFFSLLWSQLNESVMSYYIGSGSLTGNSSHVTGERLNTPFPLGYLNNSLRCVDAIGTVCACVYACALSLPLNSLGQGEKKVCYTPVRPQAALWRGAGTSHLVSASHIVSRLCGFWSGSFMVIWSS